MKKVIKLFVACIISVLAICNVDVLESYAANVSVTFGSSSYSQESGEEFPIGVYIKSDSVIGTHAIRLKYDNTRMQYLRGATKEANGVILLKGTGGNSTIKYWLEFKALSGGTASISSDVAKVYVNSTELVNVTALPSATINIAGADMLDTINRVGGISDDDSMDITSQNDADMTQDGTSGENTDYSIASTGQPMDGVDFGEDSEAYNSEENEESEEDTELHITSDTDIDDKNDKEKNDGKGKFLLSVLLNLVIFSVLTVVGIKIISAIGNKKKKRLSAEFEDEFVQDYHNAYQPSFMGDEHMQPIPFNEYNDNNNMYNYQDDAIRYNPQDMNRHNNLDVEFLSHDPIIEQMSYGQSQQMHANNQFNYIEQNLERSLEQQIRDQMNDMY